ncbi:unnamed protein product [Acanthoscelides obtectus]|uniref:Uncharacterized protein n=1 Tax=Acanthoscelides obtectus TaxID=200917 RepID=A0A9P0JXG5_ACAOB|nr:unnamed protein product [Acanthoscelides obtectus]CAK1639002.1 hypothetical protein AOBTE_LOCUS10937 [Acanthoscelides obtectus]
MQANLKKCRGEPRIFNQVQKYLKIHKYIEIIYDFGATNAVKLYEYYRYSKATNFKAIHKMQLALDRCINKGW